MLSRKKPAMKWLGLLASTLPMTGCADKARPDFERCEQLEKARQFDEARKACQLAHSRAPDSEAGKLAEARLPVLANEQREYDEIQSHTLAHEVSLPELHVDTGKVDHVEITPPGQPKVVLDRKDGSWRLTSPPDAPANEEHVASMVQNLGELQLSDVVDPAPDGDAIEKFRVGDGKATHVVATGGGALLFEGWFGESGGRGQMLRLAGDKRIFVVKGYQSYRFNRLPQNWLAPPG